MGRGINQAREPGNGGNKPPNFTITWLAAQPADVQQAVLGLHIEAAVVVVLDAEGGAKVQRLVESGAAADNPPRARAALSRWITVRHACVSM
jgi:hypothetical protein